MTDPENLIIEWLRSRSGALVCVTARHSNGVLYAAYGDNDLDHLLRMASETGRFDPYSDKLPDDLTMAEAIVIDMEG